MDTQNTPVHIRLWHRDFWFLAVANLLLTMAVYMQYVSVSRWMVEMAVPPRMIGWAMGIYAVGLFVLGGFCSYLVQQYRRNKVCMRTMFCLAACLALPVFLIRVPGMDRGEMMVWVRGITGALFGLAQMILSSTLVIDTCEAHQRTEANYAASWFGRFAISLGPMMAMVLLPRIGFSETTWVAVGMTLAALILLSMARFPFRTPEDDVHLYSLDRFLLPEAWGLFFNLIIVTVVFGVILGLQRDNVMFFAFLMPGFLLAVLAEKVVFVNAELKSETVTGLILLAFAILLQLTGRETAPFTVPVLVGLGMGLIGSRFLLFFIKLSHHCQRGTSQSSFFLAWEAGIALGLGLAYGDVAEFLVSFTGPGTSQRALLLTGLSLVALALLMYVAFTHSWYMRHKNR